jgi:hypothetical protein
VERSTGFEPATSTLGKSLKGGKQRNLVKGYRFESVKAKERNPVCHHGVTIPEELRR